VPFLQLQPGPQAVKGFTINSLKAKLKKHGVAVTKRHSSSSSSSSAGAPAFYDLNNLFEVSELQGTCFRPPTYLSIAAEEIDVAMGEGPAASGMRQRQIYVSGAAAVACVEFVGAAGYQWGSLSAFLGVDLQSSRWGGPDCSCCYGYAGSWSSALTASLLAHGPACNSKSTKGHLLATAMTEVTCWLPLMR
jgi:hypothetical protein